jgi:hypothetical protein
MNGIICLVEGSYWNGITAIVNSAIRNNFTGCIYIGYRGEIPKWLVKFEQIDDKQSYLINHNIQLKLVEINSQRHLGYEKPFFIEKIINSETLNFIFYFDVDCVSVCNFDFYLTWSEKHIALCMDECFGQLHISHPWKVYWQKKLNEYHLPLSELNHPYINSGFIGLSKMNFDIITIWKNITLLLEKEGFDTKKFNKSALLPIQGDQEILNMALMTKETHQLSIIGKEGMGFTEPCYLMVHCTKPEKPWEKLFLVDFIKKGYPIAAREKKYLDFLTKPYNNLGKTKTLFKKIDIFMTKIAYRVF